VVRSLINEDMDLSHDGNFSLAEGPCCNSLHISRTRPGKTDGNYCVVFGLTNRGSLLQ
jgi:hypothetical protein